MKYFAILKNKVLINWMDLLFNFLTKDELIFLMFVHFSRKVLYQIISALMVLRFNFTWLTSG